MAEVNEKSAASVSASELGSGSCESLVKGDDIRQREEVNKGKRSSAQCRTKKLQGKKKHKVDWTPELHKRFVQAVEQLGLEKAVPSRILELMGIDCLTRYNVASHLQKYRTHQRRSLTRKSEVASSKQRSHIHGACPGKTAMNPWIVPTAMGFPPPHFRPLHVWGHPSVEQSMHSWPKYLNSPPPTHSWPSSVPHHTPLPPFVDPYLWHYSNHQYRFPPTQPVPGVPPSPMSRIDPGLGVPVGQTMLAQPPSPLPPLKESVDTAIEDVLSKPWLPLPLGLKSPSVDSVMVELQRQGIYQTSLQLVSS